MVGEEQVLVVNVEGATVIGHFDSVDIEAVVLCSAYVDFVTRSRILKKLKGWT